MLFYNSFILSFIDCIASRSKSETEVFDVLQLTVVMGFHLGDVVLDLVGGKRQCPIVVY